jgi:hypothetical protein
MRYRVTLCNLSIAQRNWVVRVCFSLIINKHCRSKTKLSVNFHGIFLQVLILRVTEPWGGIFSEISGSKRGSVYLGSIRVGVPAQVHMLHQISYQCHSC